MPLIKRRIQDDVDDNDDEVPEISKREAISWIAIFIAWISMLSYYLVDAIDVIALLHPSYFVLVLVVFVCSLTRIYIFVMETLCDLC
jgi:nitrate reductase beta subunit